MKHIYIFIIVTLTFTNCNDGPNTFNYIDLNDKDGNFLCKLNPVDSSAIIYFDNKERYMTGKLLNMRRDGIWKEYTSDGNEKTFEWTFKNDLKEGVYYGFYMTGKIETVGSYKNDKLNSYLLYFDLKGKPEKIQFWDGLDGLDGCSVLTYSKDFRVKNK